MTFKTVIFGLLIVLFVNYSSANNFTDCPFPDLARKVVYDKQVKTSVVGSAIRIRVPDSLFLKSIITCIVIRDNTHTDIEPEIVEGGVGYYWTVINIAPKISELLSFRILVFTNELSVHENA